MMAARIAAATRFLANLVIQLHRAALMHIQVQADNREINAYRRVDGQRQVLSVENARLVSLQKDAAHASREARNTLVGVQAELDMYPTRN